MKSETTVQPKLATHWKRNQPKGNDVKTSRRRTRLTLSAALAIGVWLLMWGGYNSGPWYWADPRFPRGLLEFFHGVRAFFPLLGGWCAIVLLLAKGSLKMRLLEGPLGLVTLYGVVGLAASGVVSREPAEALYWGGCYLSVVVALVMVLSARDPLADLSNLIFFNWVFDAIILITLLGAIPILGNALVPTAGSPLGVKAYGETEQIMGMAFTRNTGFARYAAVAGLAALGRIWRGRPITRVAWGVLLLVAMYSLVLSQGRTEVVAFIAGAFLVLFLQKTKRVLLVFAGVTGALLLGLQGFYQAFWGYITRTQKFDATLSGRTETWQEGWKLFQQSPWWGYGFQADRLYLGGEHMHNVVFQALVQSGVIGTVALMLALLIVWAVVLKVYVLRPPANAALLLSEVPGVLLFFTVSSFTESTFAYFSAAWLMAAPLLAYIEVLNWQSRAARARAPNTRLTYLERVRIARARPMSLQDR